MATASRHAPCDCCSLQCPTGALIDWTERRPARRLKVLGPAPVAGDNERPGPYRTYMVEHRHRVCPACHAHLSAGGEFRAVSRDARKLAFLALVVVLAALLAAGPILLPHLLSALWLAEGEGGR